MNAIVDSYTSSDSEDDLSKEDERISVFSSLNDRAQQAVSPVNKPASLPRKNNALPLNQEMTSIVVTRNTDTLYQDIVNISRSKRTSTLRGIQSQPTSSRSACSISVPDFKKDNVMPYVPKAKRKKLASELEDTAVPSEHGLPNKLSSVFKGAKMFSKQNIFHYYAPKRKLVHFDAHRGSINRISWNPCFQDVLLSASMDSAVKVWNVETTPSCVQVSAYTQAVKDAKWSLDGVKILSGGYDKFTRITDISVGKEVCANKHNSFVTCVLYHPSNPNVYLSGTANDGIFAWDIRVQQSFCRYRSFFGQIQDITFLPDGQSFISAAEISRRNSTDKGIMVWDYNTSTVLSNQVFQEAYTCTALQVHPHDGTFLAQCSAGYIAVFSQKSPYKLNKYKRFEGHSVSGYHIGMDISPDGSLVASGSSDCSLHVYNYRTTRIAKSFALDLQACMDVAWSPSVPGLMASCDWNGRIFLHR